jgi:hypothetical protein
MKASVPEVTIGRLSVGGIDVSQVSVGPLHAARLVLDSTHVDVATGAAAFSDLQVTVTLTMRIDWTVRVKIPLARTYTWQGTVKIGTHSFTVRLGDVTVPGLESFSLDAQTASFDAVEATLGPLRNLRLGPLVAEQLRMQGVVAPVPSFTLTGLGLGRVGLAGLGVPGVTSTAVTIDRAHGQALPMGSVTIPDLRLPQASTDQVTSGEIDVSGRSRPIRFVADAGLLTLTLHTTPGVRLRTRELRLSNVRTSASIGSIELQDVVLPYELLGLTLSDLGIELIDVPTAEVV